MKLNYSFLEIAEMVHGNCLGTEGGVVSKITTDSRRQAKGDDVLFVAIQGEHHDAFKFIPQLINAGVHQFIVQQQPPKEWLGRAAFIKVNNCIEALQKLAAAHRSKMDATIVGITGSNGKTTVKEWLYQLLKNKLNVGRSPKSYNSQVGVPLSLLELTTDNEIALIEAGISQPNEMVNLEACIQPSIGVFIGVGNAHAHNFESTLQHIQEKLVLFNKSKLVLVPYEYEQYINSTTFTWGSDPQCDLEIKSKSSSKDRTQLVFSYNEKTLQISIPFTDDGSIENACVCMAFLCATQNGNIDEFLPKFSSLEPLALRVEIQDGLNGNIIINDSYSADLSSLEIALDLLDQQAQKDRVLVLSAIEMGASGRLDMNKQLEQVIKQHDLSKVITVGASIASLSELIPEIIHFENTSQLIASNELAMRNSAILLKGARKFEFERIAKQLQMKKHDTVLEIDLDALSANLNVYRSIVKPTTKLMCMVKAFGYGSGDTEVARLMAYNGVHAFGVAYADEGVSLRNAGITNSIMVMNAEQVAFGTIIENKLEPVIFNVKILDQFIRELINYGIVEYPIHLELETGMNRLGIRPDQETEVLDAICAQPEVKVVSVFSHLSVSDDRKQDTYSHQQIAKFKARSERIENRLGYSFTKHICNSAGIVRFPEAHMDMVRLGIGLYGIDPSEEIGKKLRPVSKLRTTLSQVYTLAEAASVGYGRVGQAMAGDTIGVLPIGYADGLKRSLGNGKGEVYVNGMYAPIIGNVCMDMTMVNLSGIDAHEGDAVEVFGDHISVTDLAQKMDTIPYEVLTSISHRVKRVYTKD